MASAPRWRRWRLQHRSSLSVLEKQHKAELIDLKNEVKAKVLAARGREAIPRVLRREAETSVKLESSSEASTRSRTKSSSTKPPASATSGGCRSSRVGTLKASSASRTTGCRSSSTSRRILDERIEKADSGAEARLEGQARESPPAARGRYHFASQRVRDGTGHVEATGPPCQWARGVLSGSCPRAH